MRRKLHTTERTRAATESAVRLQLLLLPPLAFAFIGIATARGGLWLAGLAPAALVLSGHAAVVARTSLRSWSCSFGTVGVALACAALLALAAGPALGLYRTVTVLSGSMRPIFAPGDVIVVTPEPARDLRVGQVITYQVPIGGQQVETHRVVRILAHGNEPIVQTKGDANNAVDPWQAKLHGGTLWRYRARIPLIGYAILALRAPLAHWILVLLVPGLLALYALVELWRPRPRPVPQHARSGP